MSKFSRFVTEAAHKGLLTLTKLENGQLEVGPPGAAARSLPAGQEGTESHAPRAAAAEEGESTERPRRGRRGGRGRDRAGRGPRATAVIAPSVDEYEPAQRESSRPAAAAANGDEIGSSGLRLTREEAFNLVRLAVGENTARASQVRSTARDLLGRDSESLSERNFLRILQDAHDANVVDLRRRGGDYDVAPAAAAAPVSQQLAEAEPPKVVTPSAPATPTGMGARGAPPGRGRGRGPIGARVGVLPPHLLSIGVVETSRPEPEAIPTEFVPLPLTGEDALSDAEEVKPRGTRKRASGEAKPRRARKTAAAASEEGEKPAPRRAARKSRSKTASE
jgi:hypothetical protein